MLPLLTWIMIAVALIVGGATGALIKLYIDRKKYYLPAIGYAVIIRPFFHSGKKEAAEPTVSLSQNGKQHTFSKIYMTEIEIMNTSTKDFDVFNFGITVPDGNKFIHFRSSTADRHHHVDIAETPSLDHQVSTIDISIRPFNKKDICNFDLVMSADPGFMEADLDLSSPLAIKLVELVTTREGKVSRANKILMMFAAMAGSAMRMK